MMWLVDRVTGELTKLSPLKAQHIEEINGENTLHLTVDTKVNKYDTVIFKDRLGFWQEFIVQGITEDRELSNLYLEHSSYELHNNIVRDKRPVTQSPSYILGQILEDSTRWTAGTSDIGGTFDMNFYYVSVYEALKMITEKTGGELEFVFTVEDNQVVGRTINLVSALGEDRGRIFSYSKDMLGVNKSINDDIITAMIGRGMGEQISETGYGRRITFIDLDKPDSPIGVDYVENTAAKEAFGLYSGGVATNRMGFALFDEIDDPEELYLETKKLLEIQSQPNVTYEVGVLLLSNPDEGVAKGDIIHVFDNDFGGEKLTLHGRILKINHDILKPENSEVIIGNVVKDLSEFQKKTDEQLSNFRSKSKIWDRASAFSNDNTLQASYISGLLAHWNELANMAGGFTYTLDGQGTVTYDRPIDQNPTKVVQIVGGTIRIANSKTPEDEWEWRTVINADGISGQEILAESITANQLRSDVGANLDISSNEAITINISAIEDAENQITELTNAWTFSETETLRRYGELVTKVENIDGDMVDLTTYTETLIRETAEGIEVGKSGSPFRIVIGENQITFWEGDKDIAYINNQSLNISDGAFFTSLQIGDFEWKKEDDGSVSFGKVG